MGFNSAFKGLKDIFYGREIEEEHSKFQKKEAKISV
jgi:hypothetical protein